MKVPGERTQAETDNPHFRAWFQTIKKQGTRLGLVQAHSLYKKLYEPQAAEQQEENSLLTRKP
jgi:hypothetical protein